jgi:hypothetical protein
MPDGLRVWYETYAEQHGRTFHATLVEALEAFRQANERGLTTGATTPTPAAAAPSGTTRGRTTRKTVPRQSKPRQTSPPPPVTFREPAACPHPPIRRTGPNCLACGQPVWAKNATGAWVVKTDAVSGGG